MNLLTLVVYCDLALKKCDQQDSWSIHGYWPEYNSSSWPQYCNHTKCSEFNYTTLDPIISQLQKYWFSCPDWNVTTTQFWKHEWCKHATCLGLTLLDFFQNTLNLFKTARQNNWYNCCNNPIDNQCLIHINETTNQWLGYC